MPTETTATANGLLWGAAAQDWADLQEPTCLQYAAEPASALREARRVTRPAGHVMP